MERKINNSNEILWMSFPALEKYDFLQQGLILKNKAGNLFSDRSKLNSDLQKSLKIIAGSKGLNVFANQVHQNKCAIFKSASDIENWDFNTDYDAFITNQKNLFLTVRVADCLPIFLLEPEARVIGLVHAGWRSTLLRIVEETLDQMCKSFSADVAKIMAVLGPGLGKGCFETSEELAILFPPDCLQFENGSRPKLDLALVNFKQLTKSGVKPEKISIVSECTHCNPDLYYSYRRTVNKNQRMVAFMGLKG